MLQRIAAGRHRTHTITTTALRQLSSGGDDGYIHRSIVPTLHFQKSLPRLPIPKLEDTCKRYLAALHPLLEENEYRASEKLVNDFLSGRGKELNVHLVASDKQNRESSYIAQPWTELYQRDRRSVVLNFNPFLGFVDDPLPEANTQLARATNLTLSSVRFYRTLRDGHLSPDIYHLNPAKSDTERFKKLVRLLPQAVSWYGAYLAKAFPLDMRQYPYLFQSSRIPRQEQDENVRFPEARHLVVVHKGHFYSFDVLTPTGEMVEGARVKSALEEILSDPRPVNPHSIGTFTSLDRPTWAGIRAQLDSSNPSLMQTIDSALFVLCLDEYEVAPRPPGEAVSEQDAIPLIKNGLHGEAHNRWFDKSFNLIVTKNGKAAVHFEHSWGDGVSVLRYFNEIFDDHLAKRYTGEAAVGGGGVERLDPILSESLVGAAEGATDQFQTLKDSFTLDVLKFEGFGKKDLKKLKISPDAVCQLAFQMAYWRMRGECVGTYESCSTAAFRFGRTETIRPCTSETRACSVAFDRDSSAGLPEMEGLLRACSKKHSTLTREAAMGQGFDRHLFALRYINDQMGLSPLPLFQDPAHAKLNHIILSTSTLVSPALEVGGFAAVVQDGLGVGYAMFEDWFGTQASYYPPGNDGREFCKQLEGVCEDLKAVLNGQNIKEGRSV